MMKTRAPWRIWSDDDCAALTRMWHAGVTGSGIGAALNRTTASVLQKAKELRLDRRHIFGRGVAISGSPMPKQADAIRREMPHQIAAWTGIRFDDSPAAARAEPMLRGLPPINISAMTTCAATIAAE